MAVAEPGAVPGWTAVNGRWSTWLRRREWARGYLLMSPTLLVMVAMLIVPMIALIIMSFWTQTVLEIDRTFTLENYWHLIEPAGEGDEVPTWMGIPFPLKRAVYLVLLLKSILMSLSATVAVILLAYPMAYFLAFRVKRHKMIWLILITIPFWTSYLLRVFAWKLMLGFNGVINSGLIKLGLIDAAAGVPALQSRSRSSSRWPTPGSPSPSCRSTSRWRRSTARCSRRRPISATGPCERFLRVTLPLSLPGMISARAAGLHPDGRRLRDADAGRRADRHHDRQRHPDAVRPGEQHAARRGAVAGHDAGGDAAGLPVPVGGRLSQDAAERRPDHADEARSA